MTSRWMRAAGERPCRTKHLTKSEGGNVLGCGKCAKTQECGLHEKWQPTRYSTSKVERTLGVRRAGWNLCNSNEAGYCGIGKVTEPRAKRWREGKP